MRNHLKLGQLKLWITLEFYQSELPICLSRRINKHLVSNDTNSIVNNNSEHNGKREISSIVPKHGYHRHHDHQHYHPHQHGFINILFQVLFLYLTLSLVSCHHNHRSPHHHSQHHHNSLYLKNHHHVTSNLSYKQMDNEKVNLIVPLTRNFPLLYRSNRDTPKQGCPAKCECIWRGGKFEVDCKGLTYSKLPKGIRSDVQVINFNGNRIKTLEPKIFQTYGLINLQKIYLSNCSLKKISDDSLASLSNLVELDLSHNYLDLIPTEALKGSRSLRRLHLNSNLIKKIDSNSFNQLTSLQLLDLSSCAITSIHPEAFTGLEKLNYLFLNGNKLRELSGSILDSLVSLKQINLHDNQWFCDCRILSLRIGIVTRLISITVPPICDKPNRLKGRSWQELEPDEFACKPKIISMSSAKFIQGRDGTLVCRIQSSPKSNVTWYFQSSLINNHAVKNATYMSFGKQYITIKESFADNIQTSRLIITNSMEKDAGRYSCAASNKAGNVTSSITVQIIRPINGEEEEGIISQKDEHMIGMVLASTLVVLLVALSVCFLALRHKTSFLAGLFKSSRSPEVTAPRVIYNNNNNNGHFNESNEDNDSSAVAITAQGSLQGDNISNSAELIRKSYTVSTGPKATIVVARANGSPGFPVETFVRKEGYEIFPLSAGKHV